MAGWLLSLFYVAALAVRTVWGLPPDLWRFVCPMYGWGSPCKNYVQATLIAMGGQLGGTDLRRAFDCTLRATQGDCNSMVARDGEPCEWCPFPAQYVEQFGEGFCMRQNFAVFCPTFPETSLEPARAYSSEKYDVKALSACMARAVLGLDCENADESGDAAYGGDGAPADEGAGGPPSRAGSLRRSAAPAGGAESETAAVSFAGNTASGDFDHFRAAREARDCVPCYFPDVFGLSPPTSTCVPDREPFTDVCTLVNDLPRGARRLSFAPDYAGVAPPRSLEMLVRMVDKRTKTGEDTLSPPERASVRRIQEFLASLDKGPSIGPDPRFPRNIESG